MAIFGNNRGLMDVIRCDEKEYLVWKWRPKGETTSSNRSNSIRYGSSLRVKDGELAIFFYQQNGENIQDFIVGPCDKTIETANFPVLASIVGLAYAGNSPFQAEIYFINLSGNVQIRFGIPYFDLFDSRFSDFAVPIAVRGTITFNITDYKNFIKLNRLIEFDLDSFKEQIKDLVTKTIKGIVTNVPHVHNIPILQIERRITEITDDSSKALSTRLRTDFGINLKAIDLGALEIDKESEGYKNLLKVTVLQTEKIVEAQTDVSVKDLKDMQQINAKNLEETLRIQREEAQRIQKLQTESNNVNVHQLNLQADVAKAAAESMGKMGGGGNSNSSGTMDPGSMMASMAMGGAVGSGLAGAVGNMMQGLEEQKSTPPPPPDAQYSIAIGGSISGPYNWTELTVMANSGKLNKKTFVWKPGFDNWTQAGDVHELQSILQAKSTPPPPPMDENEDDDDE
jgi:hypothetical protein